MALRLEDGILRVNTRKHSSSSSDLPPVPRSETSLNPFGPNYQASPAAGKAKEHSNLSLRRANLSFSPPLSTPRTSLSSSTSNLHVPLPSDPPPPPPPSNSVISPTKNPFRKTSSFSLRPASKSTHSASSRRYILLESLNASQTFILLLIPYITLFLCAFLDSSTFLKKTIHFPPPLKPGLNWIPHSDGNAFTFRGEISSIPQLSSSLTADVTYVNLTDPILLKIAEKKIFYSSKIIQRGSAVFTTKPQPLPIVCSDNLRGSYTCNSPRVLDVLFASPGSKGEKITRKINGKATNKH